MNFGVLPDFGNTLRPLFRLPEVFVSKKTSDYLAAIELLSGYQQAGEKLKFVAEWLDRNKDEQGQWDLGTGVKDGVYFPLSDSWRIQEYRKLDCTERITHIVQKSPTKYAQGFFSHQSRKFISDVSNGYPYVVGICYIWGNALRLLEKDFQEPESSFLVKTQNFL